MAAANLIREALMALLKAKKSNVSAQGTKNQIRKQGFDDFDDSSPRNPDAIELADDAAENLQLLSIFGVIFGSISEILFDSDIDLEISWIGKGWRYVVCEVIFRSTDR